MKDEKQRCLIIKPDLNYLILDIRELGYCVCVNRLLSITKRFKSSNRRK